MTPGVAAFDDLGQRIVELAAFLIERVHEASGVDVNHLHPIGNAFTENPWDKRRRHGNDGVVHILGNIFYGRVRLHSHDLRRARIDGYKRPW